MKTFLIKRPLFVACTAAFAVCALCNFLTASAMIALAVAIVFASLFIIPFKTDFRATAIVVAVACVAMIASNTIYYTFFYRPVVDYLGADAVVEGELIKSEGTTVTVRCDRITRDKEKDAVNFKARFIVDKIPSAYPSAKLVLKAKFFDSSDRSTDVHISGVASEVNVKSSHDPSSFRYVLYNIRQKLKDNMPFKDSDTSAFVSGVIFGDVSDIPGVFKNKLNSVGLSHVTSVSGMHLMFAVLLMDFALAIFAVGNKPRAVLALLSILIFTFLSGFAVSCIRAAIMLAIYYVGVITDKLSDSLTSLSVAAYLILLFSPHNICSLSFLLSVSATFGIVFFSPCFNSFFNIRFKNPYLRAFFFGLVRLLTMSLSASVCCLPITALLFKNFCVLAPAVNVVVAIPIQILFYVGIAGILFGSVPFVSDILSFAGDTLYKIIEFVVSKCYYIKNTTVTAGFGMYYIVLALIFVLVLGIYLLYKLDFKRHILVRYIAAFALICLVFFGVNQFLTRGNTKVSFVDVGDGNCSVISKDESATIIDCGGDYFDEIERVLCCDNVKKISVVAITHFNADHVNYLATLVDTYDIDCIVYPAFSGCGDYADVLMAAGKNGTKLVALETDEEFLPLDDVKLRCFVEKAKKVKPYENMSAVYRLELADSSVLYTGDMNINQEHAYLDYSGAMNCDILCVAHHGSKTSSHTTFLNLCSPDYSVISVSENSKEHPSNIVINRLEKISDVISTAKSSTITFQFNNKGYKRIK